MSARERARAIEEAPQSNAIPLLQTTASTRSSAARCVVALLVLPVLLVFRLDADANDGFPRPQMLERFGYRSVDVAFDGDQAVRRPLSLPDLACLPRER